ncbi:MAG: DUF1501 domain-containing protein [Planctomycetales bacterium]|nr:DUF1501 domain-containing protein [Planctomycetales bacterium]
MNLATQLQAARATYLSRRWFLRDCGLGLAGIAASSLLAGDAVAHLPAVDNPLAPHVPHFPGKAKRVIYIFQAGAPSHLELFDNKPELTKRNGQLPPAELLKGYRAAFINPNSALLGPKFTSGGASNYGNGFLPTVYGGIPFRSSGDPVLYLSNPPGIDSDTQRASLDSLNRLNDLALKAAGDPEIAARIQSYEMAYRLQTSAPELMDLSQETPQTLERYGIKSPKDANFARNCLLARRLIERGVRFVQLFHEAWDQHGNLTAGVKQNALDTDQASAALITDLKERGLLQDTIVIWGGEFGRTPMVQGGNDGRDHHNRCFSLWMAGGGLKAGYTHGQTDELGFNVAANPVHVHDLHATLLHLLGFDHTRLTFRFQGRDYRLTDVHGNLVKEIMA